MARERKLDLVGPRLFTSDGTEGGLVTVSSTSKFKVNAKVVVSADTLPILQLNVLQVISKTQMIIGDFTKGRENKADLSLYTTALNASIFQSEQDRPTVPKADQDRATYEQEPTLARRVVFVDEFGNIYNDENPVPTKLITTPEDAIDVIVDGVYGEENLDPDNVGLIAHERNVDPSDIGQTQRLTAIKNGDVTALDVAIKHANGSAISASNPLHVQLSDGSINIGTLNAEIEVQLSHKDNVPNVGDKADSVQVGDEATIAKVDPKNRSWSMNRYEKLLGLLANANWMKLGDFDSIVPTFTEDNAVLAYRQNGAVIGRAFFRFVNDMDWDINLERYINDSNGDILLDDNDEELFLD